MASKKKAPAKKGKGGLDLIIAVAPSGKGKPPMKGDAPMAKGKTCPDCGGKVSKGVCVDCGYKVK